MKLAIARYLDLADQVAPRAGAWIETFSGVESLGFLGRRPPCGGVD